jgi:outer membrane immunogenic protein
MAISFIGIDMFTSPLARICALLLISTSSYAADLDHPAKKIVKKAHPRDAYVPPAAAYPIAPINAAVPAVFTWAGFYSGAHFGYDFAKETGQEAGAGTLTSYTVNPTGLTAGVHAGYNFIYGSYVYGLEFSADDNRSDSSAQLPTTQLEGRMMYQFSLVGRLGYSFDHYMVYVLGGGVFEHDKFIYTGTTTALVNNQHKLGWTLGLGGEYAITDNWIARLEYRYADFGHETDSFSQASVGDFPSSHYVTRSLNEQKILAGISYKFDLAPAPILARY